MPGNSHSCWAPLCRSALYRPNASALIANPCFPPSPRCCQSGSFAGLSEGHLSHIRSFLSFLKGKHDSHAVAIPGARAELVRPGVEGPVLARHGSVRDRLPARAAPGLRHRAGRGAAGPGWTRLDPAIDPYWLRRLTLHLTHDDPVDAIDADLEATRRDIRGERVE
ncbi:MAG: hypothetical protein M1832_000011 [Thelocarpon impressellum]|nr:MAG: hypothetical protein M1832_000011 [Thelocarpon impressellum]